MKRGDYIFHSDLGTLKIIDVPDGGEKVIVQSLTSTHELLNESKKIRNATLMESVDFDVDMKGIGQNWFKLHREIPNIQSVFNEYVYKTTTNFLDNNKQIMPTKFGASTNIFYSEYIFAIDDKQDDNLYKFREWNHYDFAENDLPCDNFKSLKPKLQSLVFGEESYSSMEGSNNHQINRDLMNVVVEAFLTTQAIIPKLSNCKLAVSDHDEIELEANLRIQKIIKKMG